MKLFSGNTIVWRLYVAAALIVAGIISPLVYAPVPWLMLLAYLLLSFRPWTDARRRNTLMVPYDLAVALSLPLFYQPLFGGSLSVLLSLPVLPLLDRDLRVFASASSIENPEKPSRLRWRLTRPGLSVVLSLSGAAAAALAITGWTLLLSVGLVVIYLLVIANLVFKSVSGQPVTAGVVSRRVLAGSLEHIPVKLVNQSRLSGHLRLFSSCPWFFVRPDRLVLNKPELEIETTFTPPLSGSQSLSCRAAFVDPWGLLRFDFTLKMMAIVVTPRAKYAEWMAREYLGASRGGRVEAMTSVAPSSRRASSRGIEFYGLRPYQPGDSMRTVDWKHTSKLHQMIVREFLDTSTECAVVAINLSVPDEEEKDRLVYDLITRSLTLAGENIPSALTAWNDEEVVKTTRLLDPRQALVEALSLIKEVSISPAPLRYLASPDVGRLRANLYRLRLSDYGPAQKLAGLLQLEYNALGEAARKHPAAEVLSAALAGVKGKPNILLISAGNGDDAVVAFNRDALERRGYRFLV